MNSQVARRFLAAVEECSGPDLNMALFISYDPEDIVRQAEESTLRYQQGKTKVSPAQSINQSPHVRTPPRRAGDSEAIAVTFKQ